MSGLHVSHLQRSKNAHLILPKRCKDKESNEITPISFIEE